MKVNPFASAAVLFLLLGYSSQLAAQQKPAPMKLEDPEIYYAFFRSHSAIAQTIQASTATAATQLTGTTAVYQINVADLPKVTLEVQKFMVDLALWQVQEQAYIAQQRLAKKLPDMKTLVNYQRQRQRLVMNAHAGLRGSLPATSWTALYGYINGDFKTSQSKAAGAGK